MAVVDKSSSVEVTFKETKEHQKISLVRNGKVVRDLKATKVAKNEVMVRNYTVNLNLVSIIERLFFDIDIKDSMVSDQTTTMVMTPSYRAITQVQNVVVFRSKIMRVAR